MGYVLNITIYPYNIIDIIYLLKLFSEVPWKHAMEVPFFFFMASVTIG